MLRLQLLLVTMGSIAIATTGIAIAEDHAPVVLPKAALRGDSSSDKPREPLALPEGTILIAGSTFNFNLSEGSAGEPISLAPSVWYGVDDKLTVGLTHDFGTTPWSPRPAFRSGIVTVGRTTTRVALGAGICLTGNDGGCSRVYDNVGVDALYAVKSERFGLAAHPGIDIGSFDPFALSVRIGVLGRYTVNDKVMIVFDPRLRFGFTERKTNKDLFDIPVWGWYAVTDKLGAYVHTGIDSTFDEFGDSVSIPLLIGATYGIHANLTAGVDLGFTRLNDGAEGRALAVRVAYAR